MWGLSKSGCPKISLVSFHVSFKHAKKGVEAPFAKHLLVPSACQPLSPASGIHVRTRGRSRSSGLELALRGIWLWLSKPMGSHFGVGEFTTNFRIYFSGDWDVHWGYDLDFDPF